MPTEQDLDLVLTLHKQHTNSYWGTRQSPDGKRPSARMMWKSQYVPFDGIPFINCGKTGPTAHLGVSRCALVMRSSSFWLANLPAGIKYMGVWEN